MLRARRSSASRPPPWTPEGDNGGCRWQRAGGAVLRQGDGCATHAIHAKAWACSREMLNRELSGFSQQPKRLLRDSLEMHSNLTFAVVLFAGSVILADV
mmetsp:Transcript_66606/g.184431  ORF Transcript_66606/g.184431 Transcript_66606/m.184431 type:complete len:99 (+) Transcript_66606:2767-3063(+)